MKELHDNAKEGDKMREPYEKLIAKIDGFASEYPDPNVSEAQKIDHYGVKIILSEAEEVIRASFKKRIPGVIIPNSSLPLNGLIDKDQNQIYRIVVYKENGDDVIKALRKKGFTSRAFEYNKEKWENDNKQK